MIKFLPSYVGSKSWWVSRLPNYQGRHFVEAFCGSAVLSANLAQNAVLIDIDPYVCQILSRFDEQIVPDVFGPDEYFAARKAIEWWRYAFCLQKLSFSGVFRYSKNGYNVPIKKREPVFLQADYQAALTRWKELAPTVISSSYQESVNHIRPDSVLVLDPPYESSQASYNAHPFDYQEYWRWVDSVKGKCTILLFDRVSNLREEPYAVRTMRVNGKHKADMEGLVIYAANE